MGPRPDSDRTMPYHFASGVPIAIASFTGSLTVISVNGWMNHWRSFVQPALRRVGAMGSRPHFVPALAAERLTASRQHEFREQRPGACRRPSLCLIPGRHERTSARSTQMRPRPNSDEAWAR
jgi:hypothetical protein